MNTKLKLINNQSSSVTFDGSVLHIENLDIENPDLAAYMQDKTDYDTAFIELIESALLVRKIANSSAEAEKLGAVADRLSVAFENASEDATKELTELIKTHTNENNVGSLANILKSKLIKSVADELKPTNEDSPFHEIAKTLSEILVNVSRQAATKEADDTSPRKGTPFNLLMDGLVQKFATETGDSPLYTNDIFSETDSKVGDEVVTLNLDFASGKEINVVWEFKTEKNVSVAAALKELSAAMENRKAEAGVFVLARDAKNAQWSPHSFHSGNRMIIVVDKDEPDQYLVKFAHIWSRWMAIRSQSISKDILDAEQIQHLISEATENLKEFVQVKSAHSGIQTSLDEAIRWTGSVEGKLKKKLSEIVDTMAETK